MVFPVRAPFRAPGGVRRLLLSSLAVAALAGCTVTPKALDTAEIAAQADSAVQEGRKGQQPVTRPIDLSEAMARAVLYNLDDRVQRMEVALRSREAATAGIGGLPSLVAGAAYTGRNEPDASWSRNVYTGVPTLSTSTSTDKDILTRNLGLSWNVLDFGLSYVRAQQAADRILVAQEERRRVLARLVEEVRTAYWKALAAEYVSRELRALQDRVKTAIDQSEELLKRGQSSPVANLTRQRDLYEIVTRIQSVESDVVAARNQLASLMNLPPGTRFSLVRPRTTPVPPSLRQTPDEMVRAALRERPEIREAIYEQRIGERDATALLLQLLPGITLQGGPNGTSNSYTYANDWISWGATASWNLMRLATYPTQKAELEAKDDLLKARLQSTAASIALQVHVSRTRYELSLKRAETLGRYSEVQQKLLGQLTASATADQSGDMELVREQLVALLAKAQHDVALADAQSAHALVLTTLGRDPYPVLDTDDLAELARRFRSPVPVPVKVAAADKGA